MSEITDLFENTIDEYSYRAGYDQCKIDDFQNVQVALDVIKYLVNENKQLKEQLNKPDEDDTTCCAICGEEFLWWQASSHANKGCSDSWLTETITQMRASGLYDTATLDELEQRNC